MRTTPFPEVDVRSAPAGRGRASAAVRLLTDPRRRAPWLFLLVPVTIVMVFQGLPAVAGIVLGLYRYDGVSDPVFIGTRNFELMLSDRLFRNALWVTAYYVVGSVLPTMVISLAIAIALNQSWLRFRGLLRTIYFIPTVVSVVALALIWQWMLNPQFGIVNEMLVSLGLPALQFLGDPRLAMPTVIAMGVWRGIGYDAVIYLAGLQSISSTYYEAAKIDGAGAWAQFRHITLPLLRPTTYFVLSISVIRGFQVFDQVYIMTGGGPIDSTRVIVWYIWHRAFQTFDLGYASAMAAVLFAIILLFTLIQTRFLGRASDE